MSENNLPTISAIHTSCKNCVFAEYSGITQYNCLMGLIDQYKDKSVEVLEVYDTEKEFYVINNKKCSAYKEPQYFKSRNLEDITIEEKIQYVKNLMKINYVGVINLMNFSLDNLSHIISTLEIAQVKPKKIILVRYNTQGKDYAYNKIKNILDQHNLSNWTIKTVLDPEDSYETVLHNIINTSKKNNFILSINHNFTNLLSIIEQAQNIVYKDFGFFNYITNQDKGTIIFNGAVYRMNIFYGIDILKLEDNPNNIII
jgi:hypothetical protein